jgi:hypothetical protein
MQPLQVGIKKMQSKYDDFGTISIDIVSTINISHIGNLFNSLTRLANKEYSLILNETYTGIEVFEYDLDTTIFEIDYEYVFVKNKEITTTFLNQRCDENLVLDNNNLEQDFHPYM